jgi:homoserine/homoserine lactone efflux protein
MPISPSTWLNFAIVALLVSLVPGPAFIVVLSTALRRGLRAGLYANAGVVAGDGIYFFLAAVGLGSLLAASYWAFTIVKWLGVAYLIYLGLRSLFYPASEIVRESRATRSERRAFITAVTVQLANPKLLLFLVALVPQFIEVGRPVAAQFAVLGATFMLTDAVVYSIVGMFAARARPLLSKPWAARTTSRITGLAMLGAAVRIGTEQSTRTFQLRKIASGKTTGIPHLEGASTLFPSGFVLTDRPVQTGGANRAQKRFEVTACVRFGVGGRLARPAP